MERVGWRSSDVLLYCSSTDVLAGARSSQAPFPLRYGGSGVAARTTVGGPNSRLGAQPMVTGPIGQPRASYAGVAVTGEQYMFVRNGVLGGLSGSEINRQMAGTDLALRRQAILDIRREVLGLQQGARVIENTPLKFFPSDAAFQPTAMPLGGKYRVTGAVNVPTPVAGEVNTIYATFTFNRPLTRGDIDAGIMSVLQPFAEAYGFADENGNLSFSSSDIDYITAEREI